MRKWLLPGIFAGIILVGLLFVFLLKEKGQFQQIDAADAVPSNAIVYIENIEYQYLTTDFPEKSLIYQDMKENHLFGEVDSLILKLPGYLDNTTKVRQLLDQGKLNISVHLLGNSNLSALFILEVGENATSGFVEEALSEAFGNNYNQQVRKYDETDIFSISVSNSALSFSFYYAIKDGLILICRSSIIIEEAIRSTYTVGGINHVTGFKEVASTAGKYVHGNLYLNYKFIHQLFYPFLENSHKYKAIQLSELAEWSEFDIDINQDEILLSGMTYKSDSSDTWLSLFMDQDPVRVEAMDFIPSNAVEFMAMGISDTDAFKSRFHLRLKESGLFRAYSGNIDRKTEILGSNPFDELLKMIDDEIVWFRMDMNRSGETEDVVMYELNNSSQASDLLNNWVNRMSDNLDIDDNKTTYHLDDQASYLIQTFPEDLFEIDIMKKFVCRHFAVYDKYLVFSNSKEAIKRVIYQSVLHKTLGNEPFYDKIDHLFSTRANFTYFIKPAEFLSFKLQMLNELSNINIDKWSPLIEKIAGIVFQYSNQEDMFYSGISIKYASAFQENALTVWESLLDSNLVGKPYLVTNHYTNETEIILQDASGAVYLINSTGRILWKQKTGGKVMSDFYQVDYYNNGKLQYLFNTEKEIHLLDRNGNYVERYPIKLRSDATNGISLFDYDKNRDFRIFVACEDRRVYVYDIEGNLINGWRFQNSEGVITQPVQHFRVEDNDYIAFSDNIRSYILNRRGRERVEINDQFKKSPNNIFYLDMNPSENVPRIITSDSEGNVIGVDFEGNKHMVLSHQAPMDHFFMMKDIDHDGYAEFLFVEENEFKVLNSEGKRLFSFEIKSDISTLPDIYQFSSNDLKFGITDSENNLIYLINSDGTLYEGFPLEGCSRFSIGYFAGSDSRFNLIVGSRNEFLYNYSIQ